MRIAAKLLILLSLQARNLEAAKPRTWFFRFASPNSRGLQAAVLTATVIRGQDNDRFNISSKA
jgi:hypothetical protein